MMPSLKLVLLLSTLHPLITTSFQSTPVLPPAYKHHTLPLSPLFTTAKEDEEVPSIIQSPVLQKVYPALLSHQRTYGHPNISLGTENGKRCKTLRRLAFQNKLSVDEISLLTDLGFRWNSFEDVYTECDFEEMRQKALEYYRQYETFQIPKKYELDPELGAWITMLRRLYQRGELSQEEIDKMNEIQFEWVSSRKCGSSFMMRYREVLEKIQSASEEVGMMVERDEDLKKWIYAQRCAFENGKLSESRVKYMEDLGVDWKNISM
jgi:hypothetical protein